MRLGHMLLHRADWRTSEQADERIDWHRVWPRLERGGKYTDRPSRLLPCVIRLQHQHIIGTQSAPCRKKPKSLRASRETLLALREHPLLKKRNKSGWSRHELFNQYYDTAERELAHARVVPACGATASSSSRP